MLKNFTFFKVYSNDFFWRVLQVAIKQGTNFAIFIFTAKTLSVYDFGVFNYVFALVYFVVTFSDFGISVAVSKFVAEYDFTNNEMRKTIIFNAMISVICISLLLSTATIVYIFYYIPLYTLYFIYLLPVVILAPIVSVYEGVYRGSKLFKKSFLVTALSTVMASPLIFYSVFNFGMVGAIFGQNILYLFLIMGLIFFEDNKLVFKINVTLLKNVGIYSIYYGLAILGNYLFARFGVLILGHYGYINEIGAYELINKVITFIVLPFNLFGQVIASNYVVFSLKKEFKQIRDDLSFLTLILTVISFFVSCIFLLSVPSLIDIFFKNYSNILSFNTLIILSIVLFFNCASAPVDTGIVIPIGYAKFMTIYYLTLGLLSTFLTIILVTGYGFQGFMYSILIATIFMSVGMRLITYIKLGKDIRTYQHINLSSCQQR